MSLESKLSPKTHKPLGAGLLLACALGAAGVALGADLPKEERQIKALQQQLQAVQAQLQQLADQNQAMLRHQQQIEQELTQQRQQLAAQAAALATAPAVAGRGGPPAARSSVASSTPGQPAPSAGNSALPGTSASPDQSASSALPGAGATTAAGTPAGAAGLPGTYSAASLPGAQPSAFGSGPLSNLRLWGYGELYYTRPTNDASRTQTDLARAVFGIGYRFDDRTEFNSEYEVEHSVASADDVGEFEVEQFYVDRQLAERVGLRAGLFLMPFGLLNEHHEPTNFYGVQRNFVETLIIPSTWREGGLSIHGDTDIGISWNAGVVTGLNLNGWDFAPEFPQYTTALELENNGSAPMQATHQELSLANGRNLAQYVAVNYFGIPGLDVGGAITTGKPVPVDGMSADPRLTLWEGHVRWTPGRFDLSALYAQGTISDLAATNRANLGSPNPLPSQFYGYFFQAAYGLWSQGDYRLNPFVRYEYYNMGSRYAGTTPMIPTGSIPLTDSPGDNGLWPINHDRVWTLGANFYLNPHVVFKADWQRFDVNSAFNRFDLGLGLNF